MDMRRLSIIACVALAACGQGQGDGSGAGDGAGEPAAQVSPDASPQVVAAPPPPPAFAVCASCHGTMPGRQGVGPSLAGVWGRQAASQPGFNYSAPLKASGIVWDAQTLDQWLQAPMKMVPGTRMVIGLPNPQARAEVIRYLEALK